MKRFFSATSITFERLYRIYIPAPLPIRAESLEGHATHVLSTLSSVGAYKRHSIKYGLKPVSTKFVMEISAGANMDQFQILH